MKQYYIQYTDDRREVFPLDETPVSPGVTRAAVSGEIDYSTVNYIEFDLIDSTIPPVTRAFSSFRRRDMLPRRPTRQRTTALAPFGRGRTAIIL